MSTPGCRTLSVVVLRRIEHFILILFPCRVLGNSIGPMGIWHQEEKAQCRFCPGLYFYPSPLYLGLKCSLNNQLESKKYAQFFVVDD